MPLPPSRAILATIFVALLVACGGQGDDPDGNAIPSGTAGIIVETLESGTPAPGLALTPRAGVVADVATARRYENEGDIPAATEAYIAIAATESPDRVEATLAAARLLIDSAHYEDARVLLEPFVRGQAGTPEGLTAVYLLGRAYANVEMHTEALAQFDAYVRANGPATPYAQLDRSDALLALQRGVEAAQAAEQALELGIPVSLEPAFLLKSSQSFERVGDFEEAIDFYQRLAEQGGPSDTALALQRIASLKQLQGDATYTVERDRLLEEYPASQQALGVLQDAEAEGDPIDPAVHGLILYRHNEYTLAEPYFREQVEAEPESPESASAYYYLGAIRESRGNFEAALENYAAVDSVGPQSPLADDALWWRARIHENEGEQEEAATLYSRIVNDYQSSSFAADAGLRLGMLSYHEEDYDEAAQNWESDVSGADDAESRQRLQLWQGKVLLQAGREDAAEAVLAPLAAESDEYFSIRARGLLQGRQEHSKATPEAGVNLAPDWDWAAAEQWLASRTGEPANLKPWASDSRWARAQELWRVGRNFYGDMEVLALIDTYSLQPGALYTLARELLAEGRISMAGGAGERLLLALDADRSDLPKALMSLAYPAAFGPLVQRYAEAEGISPLLMLAFMRQESSFNPRARSPVGALGLTQLLPESAQQAASQLGIRSEVPAEQLLHADLNLRLGARFMATQLERFDDDIFVALAAYNGGPTAAERWREIAANDADLYLETVEFAETRYYIEVVSQNYAMYRYIYGGELEPNLPG